MPHQLIADLTKSVLVSIMSCSQLQVARRRAGACTAAAFVRRNGYAVELRRYTGIPLFVACAVVNLCPRIADAVRERPQDMGSPTIPQLWRALYRSAVHAAKRSTARAPLPAPTRLRGDWRCRLLGACRVVFHC